ncbi:MAG: uroporphyrinogen decarboxylase [bacterium]|nr:uroporphyrinogen decarboxylase [bacterium]
MSQSERLLQACRREPVDKTPVWLMRQAGRYMKEYWTFRDQYDFLDMVKTPEVAAQITMQPVNAYDVDAAIIFQDLLPILEPMGLELEYAKGVGPVIHNPIRSKADVDALRIQPAEEAMGFSRDAIQLTLELLEGRIPLIGFAGAPFTLACYAIEGGASRSYTFAKGLMYGEPLVWHRLMEKLSGAVADLLLLQVNAGAQVAQVFDSWIGALSPADYREYVLPHTRRAIEMVKAKSDVPVIHFGTGTAGILSLLKEAGGDVIGVDWRVDLAEAWDGLGDDVGVQGNLDPVILFAPWQEIEKQTARILDSVKGRNGHIFNLGHGILQQTPVEHVRQLVDFVHSYTE